MHFRPVHFNLVMASSCVMHWSGCSSPGVMPLPAFWFMCISHTVLLSFSCCPHMWRVKDNVNTNTSIVSAEAPTVHCSALTDIFPLSNVTDLTMQNDRVAYADVRNLWPVSMATQLLPKLSEGLRKKIIIQICVSLPVAAPPLWMTP